MSTLDSQEETVTAVSYTASMVKKMDISVTIVVTLLLFTEGTCRVTISDTHASVNEVDFISMLNDLDNLVTTTFNVEAQHLLADSREDCLTIPDITHGGLEMDLACAMVLNCYVEKINIIKGSLAITTRMARQTRGTSTCPTSMRCCESLEEFKLSESLVFHCRLMEKD
jgi:hypothetical protein